MRPCWMLALFAAGLGACAATGQEAVPPRRVEVLPVFFVPRDEKAPTEDQSARLARHLEWSRTRYRELLPNRITFAVAARVPLVYRSQEDLAYYRAKPEGAAPQFASELLTELRFTRYNCPYVLLVVLMNPHDGDPAGGGRPLNGGYNTGGGIVIFSSFGLDYCPNFQSTLQHELGHAFGLPHVDVYGYDMTSNASLMSYNPAHHTDGFTPSPTPGEFIPEDLRGLAQNQRAFPGLRFDPARDAPPGYALAPLVPLGPMTIPGHPDGPRASTDSGEECGSEVACVVRGLIARNRSDVPLDPSTMWCSAASTTGWVSVQVEFPYDVELTRVDAHSQHGGEHDGAEAVRVLVRDSADRFTLAAETRLESADDAVSLARTKGRLWRLEFRAGSSRRVVLRGLQFFSGDDELFPPLVPYEP
ncbi:MAG: hypothetical protein HY812_12990 [Planctomycetes bacterium]|nr:hypothetical protein [Planctomycetota bacterium]